MRNFRIAAFATVCLCAALPTLAQRTVVSGTVTDTAGLPYSQASLTVTLSLPTGAIGAYLGGAQIAGTVGPVQLDSTGSFLVQLADNTQIKCANAAGQIVACVPATQWTFFVTLSPGVPPPTGTGPQTCSVTLTISGSSQTVTMNTCPALSKNASFSDPSFVGGTLPSITGQVQVRQSEGEFGGSPSTLPFDNPTSQGDTIFCQSRWTGGAFTSVTDTQGDTFTQIGVTRTTTSTFGSAFSVRWDLATNITGGASTTVTLTVAGGGFLGLSCAELSPSSVDQTASTTGAGTALSTPSVTTTVAQETLIGAGFVNVACAVVGVNGCIVGAGYTYIGNNSGTLAQFLEQQVVQVSGTYTATLTANSGSADWAMAIIAMKGTVATPIVSTASGTGPFSLGTITSQLTPVQFKISGGQIGAGQNQLNITVTTGAITNGGFALDASNDGGLSWFPVPCVQRSNVNMVASDPTPIYSAQCSIVGLMGESGTSFRFGVVQGFGISNLTVWGSI
jgi:hypothetical protein